MLSLALLLEKQTEIIELINSKQIDNIIIFLKDNKENISQILNTQHVSFSKEDEVYVIWNPEGDTFKYAAVKSNTPLTAAIKVGEVIIVQELLKAGAGVNVSEPKLTFLSHVVHPENPASQNIESMPWKMPLQCAFEEGNIDIANILLSKLNNINDIDNIQDFAGNNLLYYIYGPGACSPTEESITQAFCLLAKYGYNFNGNDIIFNDKSILQLACEHNIEFVKILITTDPNINLDIDINGQTFFEFASKINDKIIIEKCIELNMFNITPPQNLVRAPLTGSILQNTITFGSNLYLFMTCSISEYYNPGYINYSYYSGLTSLFNSPMAICPTMLINMKIKGKPFYELLVERFSIINISQIFPPSYSFNLTIEKQGQDTISKIVKFLSSYPDKQIVIEFCRNLDYLIPITAYLQEAVAQQKWEFTKTIQNALHINYPWIIPSLLSIASEENIQPVIEIAIKYIPEYCSFHDPNDIHAPNSKLKNLILLYNNSDPKYMIDWMKYLNTLSDIKLKAFFANTLLELQVLKGIELEYIAPLIKAGADFNSIIQSRGLYSSLSIATALLNKENSDDIVMKMLTSQSVNFIRTQADNKSEKSLLKHNLHYKIIEILKKYIDTNEGCGEFLDAVEYTKYAASFFLTQINSISIFSSIIKDKLISVDKKIKFLDYAYNTIKVTEYELSQEVKGAPYLHDFIIDQNINYTDKKLFLNYLTSKHNININNVLDRLGNSILHILSKNSSGIEDEESIRLIDLVIENGATSTQQNIFGDTALSMSSFYSNKNLVTIALNSKSTQTEEECLTYTHHDFNTQVDESTLLGTPSNS